MRASRAAEWRHQDADADNIEAMAEARRISEKIKAKREAAKEALRARVHAAAAADIPGAAPRELSDSRGRRSS